MGLPVPELKWVQNHTNTVGANFAPVRLDEGNRDLQEIEKRVA